MGRRGQAFHDCGRGTSQRQRWQPPARAPQERRQQVSGRKFISNPVEHRPDGTTLHCTIDTAVIRWSAIVDGSRNPQRGHLPINTLISQRQRVAALRAVSRLLQSNLSRAQRSSDAESARRLRPHPVRSLDKAPARLWGFFFTSRGNSFLRPLAAVSLRLAQAGTSALNKTSSVLLSAFRKPSK